MASPSIASTSVARISVLATFVTGIVCACKMSEQVTPPAPQLEPAPEHTTTEDRTTAPAQPARATPPPPPQPPEGMVYVPGGTFDMGPPQSVTLGKAPERVTVSAYFLDRTEVTVAAYLTCVKVGRCTPSERQPGCNATAKKPRLQHPMNCISKEQAEQYCTAHDKRLPSAAEWEFAARGTDGRSYPWGNEAAGEQVCWQGRAGGLNEDTCPVGSFPSGASPFGALDMAGNVAEWTSTEVTESAAPGGFFTRGGSYRFEQIDLADVERLHLRTDESEPFAGDNAIPTIGARCAKNL